MAYDKQSGSEEGACLVFANSSKEARKLAFPVISRWCDGTEWIDIVAKTIKGHEYLNAECRGGEPHVVEDLMTCDECMRWGTGELKDGVCETCREIDSDD